MRFQKYVIGQDGYGNSSIYKIYVTNNVNKILQFGVSDFGCSLQIFISQIVSPQTFAAPTCHMFWTLTLVGLDLIYINITSVRCI
jgi:hypothetical protein